MTYHIIVPQFVFDIQLAEIWFQILNSSKKQSHYLTTDWLICSANPQKLTVGG